MLYVVVLLKIGERRTWLPTSVTLLFLPCKSFERESRELIELRELREGVAHGLN